MDNMKIYLFFTKPWLRVTFAENLWHETALHECQCRTAKRSTNYVYQLECTFCIMAHGNCSGRCGHAGAKHARHVCQICFVSKIFSFFLDIVSNKLNHGFSFGTKTLQFGCKSERRVNWRLAVDGSFFFASFKGRLLLLLLLYPLAFTVSARKAIRHEIVSADCTQRQMVHRSWTIKIKTILEATWPAAAAKILPRPQSIVQPFVRWLRCMWNLKLKWIENENLLFGISLFLFVLLFQFWLSLASLTTYILHRYTYYFFSNLAVCLVQLLLV